eukprot:TRINITY_DN916_c0_g1_i3.p1 TRINITY_DN916_c0_g1~~TRINITY_DN916_c0_g1_i3.p1  ORF type:complete len:609 (-),score=254.99 TRINITY_DN916_c0_g1_i3:344-2170(-)
MTDQKEKKESKQETVHASAPISGDVFKRLWKSKEFSDLTVISASSDKIAAHKLFLALHSSVLAEQLFPSSASSSSSSSTTTSSSSSSSSSSSTSAFPSMTLKIDEPTNVLMAAFEFLYTGKLNLSSLSSSSSSSSYSSSSSSSSSSSLFFSLMKFANKYKMASLQIKCNEHLHKGGTKEDAIALLKDSTELGQYESFICSYFDDIIEEEDVFFSLSQQMLINFVKSDYMPLSEMELISVCMKWCAAQQKKKQEKEKEKESKEEMDYEKLMSPFAQYIRFPLMTMTELSQIAALRIIPTTDMISIMTYVNTAKKKSKSTDRDSIVSKYNCAIRKGRAVFYEGRHVLSLSDDKDYVSIGQTDHLGMVNNSYTVEMWFYATEIVSGDQTIVGSDTGGNSACAHYLLRDAHPYLGHYCDDVSSKLYYPAKEWHHLAFVFDKSTGEQIIYLDGKVCAQSGSHNPLNAGVMLNVGRYAGGRNPHGYLAELRIWSVARSQKQIKNRMFSHIEPTATIVKNEGLSAVFPFSEDEYDLVYARELSDKQSVRSPAILYHSSLSSSSSSSSDEKENNNNNKDKDNVFVMSPSLDMSKIGTVGSTDENNNTTEYQASGDD